jgi:hypothetical protein
MNSSNREWTFDGAQARQYVEAIAFPRGTGTEGETKAAQTIVDILTELGYQVRQEEFRIRIPPWVWMKGFLVVSLGLLVLTQLSLSHFPGVSLLSTGLLILWIAGWERVWIRWGRWLVSEDSGRGTRSRNIFAELPDREKGQLLYLVAHYDSKSQFFNLYMRGILFLLGNLGMILFAVWVWGRVLRDWGDGRMLSQPAWAQIIFLALCGLVLLAIVSTMGNASAGAVDNASGVGVLLEVARSLKYHPPSGVRPIFLFTGAEEWGLLGALMVAKKHGPVMLQQKALLINIDSVGRGILVRGCSLGKQGRKWLGELIEISPTREVQLRHLPFLKGVMMDHLAFAPGIPSISLTSIYREGWHIHTPRDTLALIHTAGLEAMGRLVLGAVESSELKGN